jgi:hypothetical protein
MDSKASIPPAYVAWRVGTAPIYCSRIPTLCIGINPISFSNFKKLGRLKISSAALKYMYLYMKTELSREVVPLNVCFIS